MCTECSICLRLRINEWELEHLLISEHAADNTCIKLVPFIITNRSPHSIPDDLYTTFEGIAATNQFYMQVTTMLQ